MARSAGAAATWRAARHASAVAWLVAAAGLPLQLRALEIEVEVAAAWPAAPLAAELLEGLAEVGSGPQFLQAVAAEATVLNPGSGSAEEGNSSLWRSAVARAAQAQLCCDGRSSFGRLLSLWVRHAVSSARVEAARGLDRADRAALLEARAATSAGGCKDEGAWAAASIGAGPVHAACSPAAFATLLERLGTGDGLSPAPASEGGARLGASPLDHVLYEQGSSDSEAFVKVVGYASLGSAQDAGELLGALFGLVEKLRSSGRPASVVFRHGVATNSSTDTAAAPLAGYGVELNSRSADEVTKSADGSAVTSAAQDDEGTCSSQGAGAADPVEQFHGIDLGVLVQNHPDAANALCKFQGDLKSEVEKPSPPWKLKRLGAHAALRAVRAASSESGSDLAGLAALEEAAQDYPAGWAHALAQGSHGEEGAAREVLEAAASFPEAGHLEVNGWKVPEHRVNMLSLLQTFGPMFRAAEAMAAQGFNETKVVSILRSSQSRLVAATKLDFGDPRLAPNEDRGVALLYDARSDESTKAVREQERREQYPALMRLAHYYGRYWTYPPPLPRALVGVGLVLDPCKYDHFLLVKQFSAEIHPLVVWARMVSDSHPKAAALIQANMPTPQNPSGLAGAVLLEKFWSGQSGDSDICKSGVKKRLKGILKGEVKKAPVEGTPGVGLPVPSATVNGNVLSGDALLAEGALATLCRQEVERILIGMRQGGKPDADASDEDLATWQYTRDGGVSRQFHPVLSSGQGASYTPLKPEWLRQLPGGRVDGAARRGPLAVHLLLLGEPDKDRLGDAAQLLQAYSAHLARQTKSKWETVHAERWLKVAVAGGCSGKGSALTLSTALSRCLAAAMPGSAATSSAKALGEVADALSAAAAAAGAEGAQQRSHVLLAACRSVAGSWAAPQALDGDDAAHCEAQWQVQQALGPAPDGAAVVAVNGRRFGPLYATQNSVAFDAGHVALAEDLEMGFVHGLSSPLADMFSEGADGVTAAVRDAGGTDDALVVSYGMAMRARALDQVVASQVGADQGEGDEGSASRTGSDTTAKRTFEQAPEKLRLELKADPAQPCPLQVYAIVDPLGKDAQRLPPMLRLLHEELNAQVSIVLKPRALVSAPLLNYYRPAPVAAAPAGGLGSLGSWDGHAPKLRFSIPPRKNQLLHMQLHTPAAWLCSAVDSGDADLDNLSPHRTTAVRARYVLESLFVEGWATMQSGEPAASRHLALSPLGAVASSASNDATAGRDSVVVKSGYFQLRAPPGLYRLSSLSSDSGEHLIRPRGAVGLVELAGLSKPLQAKVAAGVGDVRRDVASSQIAPEEASAGSYDGAGGDPKVCSETIHIFSVASGHRYERLLRIMMLSVREHTKCPLRLWLVNNFLSPAFRQMLPTIAQRVGFAVSRVTYKWPAWLREQTEKQRVIWAYKILFLDTLFPKQVERVLFIDADQIVRADIKDLWDMNLKGAVYGFVPFCGKVASDSMLGWGSEKDIRNPDTVGFRFWEQGFWETHLSRGRKVYHISALFVVDLKKFRHNGAGDILREVYQSLTADPHSLANLDQDLPNYVQHSLPIFSLPQEWLWCESWCSEESKAKAKTIDMCQNPVKKEGKLDGARRIAPEWTGYDQRLQGWIQEAGFDASG